MSAQHSYSFSNRTEFGSTALRWSQGKKSPPSGARGYSRGFDYGSEFGATSDISKRMPTLRPVATTPPSKFDHPVAYDTGFGWTGTPVRPPGTFEGYTEALARARYGRTVAPTEAHHPIVDVRDGSVSPRQRSPQLKRTPSPTSEWYPTAEPQRESKTIYFSCPRTIFNPIRHGYGPARHMMPEIRLYREEGANGSPVHNYQMPRGDNNPDLLCAPEHECGLTADEEEEIARDQEQWDREEQERQRHRRAEERRFLKQQRLERQQQEGKKLGKTSPRGSKGSPRGKKRRESADDSHQHQRSQPPPPPSRSRMLRQVPSSDDSAASPVQSQSPMQTARSSPGVSCGTADDILVEVDSVDQMLGVSRPDSSRLARKADEDAADNRQPRQPESNRAFTSDKAQVSAPEPEEERPAAGVLQFRKPGGTSNEFRRTEVPRLVAAVEPPQQNVFSHRPRAEAEPQPQTLAIGLRFPAASRSSTVSSEGCPSPQPAPQPVAIPTRAVAQPLPRRSPSPVQQSADDLATPTPPPMPPAPATVLKSASKEAKESKSSKESSVASIVAPSEDAASDQALVPGAAPASDNKRPKEQKVESGPVVMVSGAAEQCVAEVEQWRGASSHTPRTPLPHAVPE
eukprot:Hpha_TRINITY_DN16320_c2_g1::TRINITY_DN16320_c2_g1_i1::g.59929::m.59929